MVAPSTSNALAKTKETTGSPAAPATPSKPKPKPPTAEALLDFLHGSPMNPRQLAEHFQCSLRQIEAALDHPDFLLYHKLQQKLAHIQSRLTAAEAVAVAVDKTVGIMNFAERPEVARRAASSLLQMAGIPTRTSAQQPPAPLPDPPAPAATPEELADGMEHLSAAAFLIALKRVHGLDLDKLSNRLDNDFAEHIRAYFDKHKIPYTWGEWTS